MASTRRLRSVCRPAPLIATVGFAFVILRIAPSAQAQVVHYVNSGTINYPRLGLDLIVDATNPITITVANGAEISSNSDLSDGYQSMEIFYNNQLDVTGGMFVTEGGRPGGITAHNNSGVSVGGGTMDYVRLRDQSNVVFSSGMVGSLEPHDQTVVASYGGSFSGAVLDGSSRMEVYGGAFGSAGFYGLENSRVNVNGTHLQISQGTAASYQGQPGILYVLTGSLESGATLDTQFFDANGVNGAAALHLRFNGQEAVGVILPEADAGALFAVVLAIGVCRCRQRSQRRP